MRDVFKPEIDKKIDNNRSVFCSFVAEATLKESTNINEEENPIDVINRLQNSGTYLFNRGVIIKTKDRVYDTKIAGIIGNKVITLDSNTVSIEDIISIKEK